MAYSRGCSLRPPVGKSWCISECAATAQVRIPWAMVHRSAHIPRTSHAYFLWYISVHSLGQSIHRFYFFWIFAQCIALYGSVEAHSSLTTSSVAITTITPLDHVVIIRFIIHQYSFGQDRSVKTSTKLTSTKLWKMASRSLSPRRYWELRKKVMMLRVLSI